MGLSYQQQLGFKRLIFSPKELIGQQFSGSIMCIVWTKHAT